MNKMTLFGLSIILTTFLTLAMPLEGRIGGGGGGGRGGGGGGGRGDFGGGQRAAGRSGGQQLPHNMSMSRAQVPQRNNYAMQSPRPSAQFQVPQQRSQILSSPSVNRLSQANRSPGQSRMQLQQHLNQSNLAQRATPNFQSVGQSGRLSNFRQTLQSQGVTARNVRQNLGSDHRNWFNNSFWNDHNYHPAYWNNAANWWGGASWAGVDGWLGYGWNEPVYYQEGYPIPINDTSGTNYLLAQPSEDLQYAPSNLPYQAVAQSDGRSLEGVSDWLPLGVYALVNDANNSSDPNMFFQLAISKEGEVAGSYYNDSSDQIYPLEGLVDQTTQIAAWKMSVGEGSPIFQTGIFNLTKDQTTVEVTYSDGSKQNWLLIRINNT